MECLCCEGKTFDTLDYINEEFPNTEIFDQLIIKVCSTCGFGFLESDPAADQINNFYHLEYRGKDSPFYLDFGKIGPLKNLDPRAFAQLATGISFVNFKPFDAFLDLGPGNGNSFAMANFLLPSPRLHGVELNLGAIDYYRKTYSAICFKNMEEIIFGGPDFQIILLSHSLEHIRKDDLLHFISQIRKILSEEGICIIEVPNDDFRKKELHARLNDSPHLLFFSTESIEKLFIKSGFKVMYLKVLGNSRIHTTSNFRNVKKDLGKKVIIAISKSRLLKKLFKNLKARLLSQVIKFVEINPKGFTDNLLNQFTVDGSRDCIRIVIQSANNEP